MRIAMRLSCCVVLIVGMMGVVAPASVRHMRCSQRAEELCVLLGEWTLRRLVSPISGRAITIWNRPHEDYQIAQCLTWLGYVSRG